MGAFEKHDDRSPAVASHTLRMTPSDQAPHPTNPAAGGLQIEDSRSVQFYQWCFFVAAGWRAVVGLIMVLAAFDDTLLNHERMLKQPDPVLEFSTRNVLLLAGAIHLVLGTALFIVRDLLTNGLLMLWGCSVCAIYRLGFGWLGARWMQPGAPCPVVELTADKVGIKPKLFGFGWELMLGAMVLVVLVQWMLEWRRRKRMQDAEFMAHWRETHERKDR